MRPAIFVCAFFLLADRGHAEGSSLARWDGGYAGISVGAVIGQASASTTVITSPESYFGPNDFASVASAGAQSVPLRAGSFDAHAGFNWQTSNLVLGIETTIGAQKVRGGRQSAETASAYVPGYNYTIKSFVEQDWLWTLRPRLGFASGDMLFFATGGIAVGNVRGKWNYSLPAQTATESGSESVVKVGFVVGAGVEMALSKRWSVNAELLRVDLGSISVDSNNVRFANGAIFPQTVVRHVVNFDANLATLGLRYRF
jgi:outer membrane immunogenic protein